MKKLNIHFSLIQSFYWCAYGSMLGYPMLFFTAHGFSYTQVGIMLAMVNLVSGVVQPLFPPILQKFRGLTIRKFVILCWVTAIFLTILIYFLPDVYGLFFLVFIFVSITQAATYSLINSLTMEYYNAGLEINFGLTRGVGSASYAVLMVILGRIIASFGLTVVLISNLIFLTLLIITILFLKDPPTTQIQNSQEEKEILQNSDTSHSASLMIFFHKNKNLVYMDLSTVILFIGSSLMSNSFAPNYVGQFGGGSSESGIIIFFSAMSELPAMAVAVQLLKLFPLSKLMYFSSLCFFLKALLIYLSTGLTMLTAVQVLQGFSYGFFTVYSVLLTNDKVSLGDRVLGQGILFAMIAVGCTIGSYLGGVFLDAFGVRGLSAFSILFCMIGAVLVSYTILRIQKEKKECI